MSVREIEQAIADLSPDEVESLAKWFEGFRTQADMERAASVRHGSEPASLADLMGDLLGAVGQTGSPTTSRDAGALLTENLIAKKRERRL